ncbi:MAG: alpha/beta hydrolase [Infirmifilum sp.]|uniref:alpha/beta hydrolase n=1 Tax=Infirmifilum TaxID=2856573 RepID=UPI00235456A3
MRLILLLVLLSLYLALTLAIINLDSNITSQEGYLASNGSILRYKIWYNKDLASPRTVVFLFHGFGGSSEMMSWIAVELARNGFLAVAYDTRGHGKSSGKLSYNTSVITGDYKALIEALNLTQANITLVGHSMGGAAVQLLVQEGFPVKNLIVVASQPRLNPSPVRSLLVLAKLDEIFNPSSLNLSSLIGWRIVILPCEDHLSVLYSPRAIQAILDYLTPYENVNMSGLRLAVTLARSFTLLVLLSILPLYLTGSSIAPRPKGETRKVVLAATLAASLAPLTYILFAKVTSAPIAAYILSVLLLQALGSLVAVKPYREIIITTVRSLELQYVSKGLLMGLVIYLILYETLQPFMNVSPSISRVWLFLSMLVIITPTVFLFEMLGRPQLIGASLLGSIAKSFITRSLGFLAAWLVVSAIMPAGFAGYLLIVTFMSLILLLPIESAATVWVYKGGSPWVNVVWISLVLGLILSAVTPLV